MLNICVYIVVSTQVEDETSPSSVEEQKRQSTVTTVVGIESKDSGSEGSISTDKTAFLEA
jgi:hypothetical protein